MTRTFKVSGKDITDSTSENAIPDYIIEQSVELNLSRDGGDTILVNTSDDALVEFQFDDATFWMGSVGDMAKILNSDGEPSRGFDDGIIEIPALIPTQSVDRGSLRNVILKTIHFIKPKGNITEKAVRKSAEILDNKIQPNPGLFFVKNDFTTVKINTVIKETEQPYLLFIHGTAASLNNSFHKMVEQNQFGLWENLKRNYGDRILALEHYSISKSPFENAIEVLKWLPKKVTLHIISTSRGGLVGELLAKYSDNEKPGLSPEHREAMVNDFGANSIQSFETECKNRKITIEKFVRIACPAAGTTLCSTRLDHYLNLMINGIGIAIGPAAAGILPVFKRLLADVLSCKARPDVLPGLFVMNPNSDFIAAINHPTENVNSSLHVIAGNNKIDLKPKAIITIISKLFYRGKNDWIVDTKSMSRGLFRKQNIGYFYHEGSDVNHFTYFANKETQVAITNAINAPLNTIAPGFESFDRNAPANVDRGLIMGNLKPKDVSGDKPVVILIPGILGSNIARGKHEVYLNFLQIMSGNMSDLDVDAQNVTATSLIGRFYTKFYKEFSDEYDVAVFPYDWRLNLKGEADKLNAYIKKIMLKAKGKTIKIVAHSMGGLVVREFINNYKTTTWTEITVHSDYKVVFLGSPLGGSFLIPEILVGKGNRIKQLAGLDVLHSKEGLLKIFSKYDGILSLLPITHTPYDFTKLSTWTEMKKNYTSVNWPIPEDATLKNFNTFHDKVTSFDTSIFCNNNFIYIAGKSDATTNGFYYNTLSSNPDKITFTGTPYGDGSVTWESGIPKEIKEHDSVYYTNVGHGDLANEPNIFDGIRELLKTGRTRLLTQIPPVQRGEQVIFDMPEQLVEDQTEENLETIMLGATFKREVTQDNVAPVTIELKCGDLKYASHPIMVGHLKSDGIMSSEKVVDIYFNNRLSKRLATGNYPGNIGESKYFINPQHKPMGALVVGMGKTEKLSGFQLEETVKQGIIEYLCSFNMKESAEIKTVGISSLLLGCGYAGLSVETALKAVISGVQKANATITNNGENAWPTVDTIEFVEIYEDRALQALIVLDILRKNTNSNFVFEPQLKKLLGSRKRLNFELNTDWWQRITIKNEINYDDEKNPMPVLTFSSSMGTAREEVRELHCSKEIIESLIDEISTKQLWSSELAKTIFELLIPNDFKMAVRNQQNLLLILDKTTAGYPWEMLQDVSIQASPLSTTVGMIRQLATDEFRTVVNYTLDYNALVIGNPDTNGFLPALPGAGAEAELVNKLFIDSGYDTTLSQNETPSTIIKKMFRSDYKIVHLAGHGLFNAESPEKSGMVIGNNVLLTVKEIEQLSCVPEMVFINCCHLGKADNIAETASQSRYKLAANLGTQLIEMGVKVVVAAGWAINDEAAMEFTSDFYQFMLDGYNFGDAVRKARKNCYEKHPNNNTWGAYQCYGDQFYTLKKGNNQGKTEKRKYYILDQVKLDLENLLNKIEANYSSKQKKAYQSEFEVIIQGVKEAEIPINQLFELIAVFYNRTGEEKMSMEYFEMFFTQNASAFNISSYVEYCRLALKYHENQPAAITELKKIITDVENLVKVVSSAALFNVLGTAYKTMASKQSGKTQTDSLTKSATHYLKAFELGKLSHTDNTMYAISNAFILSTLLPKNALILPEIKELEWSFANIKAFDNSFTFWDMMDAPRYWLCRYILQQQGYVFPKGTLKVKKEKVLESLTQVWSELGVESQKENIIEHFRLLFGFFNSPKVKVLQKELLDILVQLEKIEE